MARHKMSMLLLHFFVFITCEFWISSTSSKIIHLSTGQIKGRLITSDDGAQAWAYLGIPYAEAPVKQLRFKKPTPKAKWDGVFDATQYGPACWQNASISPQDSISEDCLRMNLIVGLNCGLNSTVPKCPVIFYIHGGAYEFDSVRMFKPEIIAENFARHGVIFVLFGYRLGILGFWSSGTEQSMGNYAIHDMILALKWTYEEIGRFGGDPDRITGMGHSTGANALALMTLVPHTERYLSQVLIMSESASKRPWFDNNLADFRQVSVSVGCWSSNETWGQGKDYSDLLKCMQSKSPADLVNAMNTVRCCDATETSSVEQIGNDIAKAYANIDLPPRIMSPRNDGINGLFPYPLKAMQSCRRPIRTMMGTTINELGHHNKAFTQSGPVSVTQACEFVAPKKFYAKWHQIRRQCRKNYGLFAGLHERSYSKTNFSFWTRLQTSMFQEYQYFVPMLREMRTLLDVNSTVYLYSLDYERPGMEGIFPWHSKDLTYILGLHMNINFTADDHRIAKVFLTYILNFVKYGDPNGPASDDGQTPVHVSKNLFTRLPMWHAVTKPDGSNFMSLQLPEPSMQKFYHKNANWFWNTVARKIEDDINII